MKTAQSIVILTGAGISAESGISTFRAVNGLWENHSIEEVATPEGFARNPGLVHQFYEQRRKQLLSGDVEPNAAHRALAELQREFHGQVTLVTQNIDDLHERAGSDAIHMHGELLKIRCTRSGQIFSYDIVTNSAAELSAVEFSDGATSGSMAGQSCPCCNLEGTLRPHVVWFGESPLFMDDIMLAVEHCDIFVAIGTSGQVYPAAGLVDTARQNGATTLELNLESSSITSSFDLQTLGPATHTVPAWVHNILISQRLVGAAISSTVPKKVQAR